MPKVNGTSIPSGLEAIFAAVLQFAGNPLQARLVKKVPAYSRAKLAKSDIGALLEEANNYWRTMSAPDKADWISYSRQGTLGNAHANYLRMFFARKRAGLSVQQDINHFFGDAGALIVPPSATIARVVLDLTYLSYKAAYGRPTGFKWSKLGIFWFRHAGTYGDQKVFTQLYANLTVNGASPRFQIIREYGMNGDPPLYSDAIDIDPTAGWQDLNYSFPIYTDPDFDWWRIKIEVADMTGSVLLRNMFLHWYTDTNFVFNFDPYFANIAIPNSPLLAGAAPNSFAEGDSAAIEWRSIYPELFGVPMYDLNPPSNWI